MGGDKIVSAVMPTAGRPRFVPMAIACFLAQTYEPKELVIVDDGASIESLIPKDDRIRYFHFDRSMVLGEKQNLGCELSRGQIICHWDDDDWSGPGRMAQQVEALLDSGKSVTGYRSLAFYDEIQRRAWRHQGQPDWVVGCSLCYLKSYWETDPFPRISMGQDNYMIFQASKRGELFSAPASDEMVYRRHASNTGPFFCWPKYYREISLDDLPPLFLSQCLETRVSEPKSKKTLSNDLNSPDHL